MDISTLLKAAEYLDKREKGDEHAYAMSVPVPSSAVRSRKTRLAKAKLTRSTHNELEKNRRAHLRHCLDELKTVMPFYADSSRQSMLGLLKQARLFIKEIEDYHQKKLECRRGLIQEQQHLLCRHKQLTGGPNFRFRDGHKISESSSSSSSICSSSATSGFYELDDVDMMGSGRSSPSEVDETTDLSCDTSMQQHGYSLASRSGYDRTMYDQVIKISC